MTSKTPPNSPDPTNAPSSPDPANEDSNLEKTDVNPRAIAWTGAALLASIVVSGFIVAGVQAWFWPQDAGPPPAAVFRQVAPMEQAAPGVEIHPARTLREVRATQTRILSQYQWVGPARQIARIPINRAVEILANAEPDANLPEESP
jgi:hypothetical protein